MIDLNNTVCDKCGSGHLEDVVVDEQLPKKAPVKKMSEAVKDSRAYENRLLKLFISQANKEDVTPTKADKEN